MADLVYIPFSVLLLGPEPYSDSDLISDSYFSDLVILADFADLTDLADLVLNTFVAMRSDTMIKVSKNLNQ